MPKHEMHSKREQTSHIHEVEDTSQVDQQQNRSLIKKFGYGAYYYIEGYKTVNEQKESDSQHSNVDTNKSSPDARPLASKQSDGWQNQLREQSTREGTNQRTDAPQQPAGEIGGPYGKKFEGKYVTVTNLHCNLKFDRTTGKPCSAWEYEKNNNSYYIELRDSKTGLPLDMHTGDGREITENTTTFSKNYLGFYDKDTNTTKIYTAEEKESDEYIDVIYDQHECVFAADWQQFAQEILVQKQRSYDDLPNYKLRCNHCTDPFWNSQAHKDGLPGIDLTFIQVAHQPEITVFVPLIEGTSHHRCLSQAADLFQKIYPGIDLTSSMIRKAMDRARDNVGVSAVGPCLVTKQGAWPDPTAIDPSIENRLYSGSKKASSETDTHMEASPFIMTPIGIESIKSTESSSSTLMADITSSRQPWDANTRASSSSDITKDTLQKQWNIFASLRSSKGVENELKKAKKALNAMKQYFINMGLTDLGKRAEIAQRILGRISPVKGNQRKLDDNPVFGDDSKPPNEDSSQAKDEYPIALNHLFQLKDDEICAPDGGTQAKRLKEAIEVLEKKVKQSDSTSSPHYPAVS